MNRSQLLHLLVLCGALAGLLGGPRAHCGVAPEGATTQARSAHPGESYRGVIVIRNSGDAPAEVKLYQTDYAFMADGRNEFGAPGKLPRSNAPWLRLSQEQVTLAPGERVTVDYEVHVPDDARLEGTYWSAIMIEPIAGMEAEPARRGRAQLLQIVRHAVQVVTEIGESGKSEIALGNARLLVEAGRRWLVFDIDNVGERWLRSDVWLELHDAQGRVAGRFTGRRLRTFPGTSVRNRIDLSSVPPGKYRALLVADGGRNDIFGTQTELEIR